MSHDKQRLNDYLTHIIEAVDRINKYTADIDSRYRQQRFFEEQPGSRCGN